MDVFMVEDSPESAQAITQALRQHRYEVTPFESPHEFFYALKKRSPKLVIVDWMLPEMDGVELVKRFRATMGPQVPVMMYTNVDGEHSVVAALGAGADDYVSKDTSVRVLLARINALARRAVDGYQPSDNKVVGPYRLLFSAQEVYVDDERIDVTPREFDLIWVLMNNPGRLFQKEKLAAAIWGKQAENKFHTLSQHIYTIRKKLRLTDFGYRLLCVYGSGYRFELPSVDGDVEATVANAGDNQLSVSNGQGGYFVNTL